MIYESCLDNKLSKERATDADLEKLLSGRIVLFSTILSGKNRLGSIA